MTLRPIPAGIILTRGEKCYHSAGASWNQVKRVRERTGYVGGAVSFRAAKGVRFSVGRAVPTYNEYEGLVEISPGVLYLTNKKLVFRGSKKSTSIPFGKLIDYALYADGIELHKTSGKPDLFLMDPPDPEYTAALINTSHRRNSGRRFGQVRARPTGGTRKFRSMGSARRFGRQQ